MRSSGRISDGVLRFKKSTEIEKNRINRDLKIKEIEKKIYKIE